MVVGLGKSMAFENASRLDAISKGVAGLHVINIFRNRLLHHAFTTVDYRGGREGRAAVGVGE